MLYSRVWEVELLTLGEAVPKIKAASVQAPRSSTETYEVPVKVKILVKELICYGQSQLN